MWTLADPWALLLLPVPLIAVLAFKRSDVQAGSALRVPDGIGERVGGLGPGSGASRLSWILPGFIWVMLVLGIAGPRQVLPNLGAQISGREIILVLDLSGSMVTRDFSIDGKTVQRIDAVKHVARQFVRGRGGDRLALILFGSKAYFATPQTYDSEAVARAINEAVIGISGRATGIGDGLGLALKRLGESDAMAKTVILLSDGVNNSGPVRPRDAARLAAAKDIRIHTIAMGPSQDEATDAFDAVDVETLKAVARISGGTSFHVRTTDDLEQVSEEIDRIEGSPREGPSADLFDERWPWFAGGAFLGMLVLIFKALLTAMGFTFRGRASHAEHV